MWSGEHGEERLELARLGDPVPARALSGQREALGRVHRQLLAIDGAAIDRAQRKDGVSDRRRGELAGDQRVDEVLDLGAGDRREAALTERRQEVVSKRRLIASDRRWLVGLAGAGPDDTGACGVQPVRGGLAEPKRRGGAERAAAQIDLRLLAPGARLAQVRKGAPQRLSVASRPRHRLVSGPTGAALPGARGAAARVAAGDPRGDLVASRRTPWSRRGGGRWIAGRHLPFS